MALELFDIVTLKRDLPKEGLHAGDEGTVVELYEPDGVEVEFFRNHRTVAVVTLKRTDVAVIKAWSKEPSSP